MFLFQTSEAIDVSDKSSQSELTPNLKAQVYQLVGRNEELRQELNSARQEGANNFSQRVRAEEKVSCIVNYLWLQKLCLAVHIHLQICVSSENLL